MHELTLNITPNYPLNSGKNSKVWNFAKGDMSRLVDHVNDDKKLAVSPDNNRSFILHYQVGDQSHALIIDHTLSFASDLVIRDASIDDMALMLAISIRLQSFYKKAFTGFCNYYPIVARAKQILKVALDYEIALTEINQFIDFRMIGKKPLNEKALSKREVVTRRVQKMRKDGLLPVQAWIKKSTKEQLQEYCKNSGCTLSEALEKLLPLSIKIDCYYNSINKEAEKIRRLQRVLF